MKARLTSLCMIGVVTLAACGTAEPTDPVAAPAGAAVDGTTSDPGDPTEAETDAGAPTAVACPNTHGGSCLGELAAGTYATTVFSPSITYTVPDGWSNLEDLSGNFLLVLDDGTYDGDPDYPFAGDPRYVGIYRNAVAPLPCEESRDPSVGRSVDAYVDWLTGHPGLDAGEPQPVTVGGLEGVYLDLALDPSWTETCVYSQGQPIVPFIIGGGPSDLHHVVLPGNDLRLYLLAYEDGTVAIEVSPEGRDLTRFLDEAQPVIDQLEFSVT